MEDEDKKFVEALLDEGLELLSSDDSKKQKKGFGALRAAFGLGSMEAAYLEVFVIKMELEYTKAMNKLSNVSKWLRIQFPKLCTNLVYVILT